MSICGGIAGKRGKDPVGIFIHNDAGSANANAAYYREYLQRTDLEKGFAHYYVASDGILQAEDDANKALHCGQQDGNANYLSIEVCQSMGGLSVFLGNEEAALKLAAQKCKQYGIIPSASFIRVHQEVYATACPHRSAEIHGGAAGAKEFFVRRITELMQDEVVNATVQFNSGAKYQRLAFEEASEALYRIRDKAKGLYMTASGSNNGDNVDFRRSTNDSAQLWKIVKKQYGKADYTMFESVLAEGKFLSVEANGIGASNLKLWQDLQDQKQKFYIREESDGYKLVIHVFSGLCVSAKT